MKIIYEKGCSGKTTQLIHISHEKNMYIMTTDKKRADNIFKKARKMGIYIPYPVTLADYMQGRLQGTHIREILIDDADDILKRIFYDLYIDTITMTKTEE